MKVIDVKDFGPTGFRWLTLKRISWEDADGRVRFWETAERTTRRGEVDGVAIVARVLKSGQVPHIVIISQFRPPLGKHCLELPAGLVDGGEDAAQAAVRELREETGYVGRVVDVTPTCDSDPGMSGANMRLAVVEVDGDAQHNHDVVPHLEDGEFISTDLVPLHGLLDYLLDTKRKKGWGVDARLMAFAVGLQMGAATTVSASAAGAGAQPGLALASELSGFGSLVPDDASVGHAVEAAMAAVDLMAEPSNGVSASGKVEAAVREALGTVAAAAGQQPNPGTSGLDAPGMRQLAQGLWDSICTPQFAAGLATGLAAAAVVWKCR